MDDVALLELDATEATLIKPGIPHWTNHDNAQFYEEVSVDALKTYVHQGGLDTHCDLELIKTYIALANSILEVGAGYGRVLEHLLNNKFPGKISAIERSKNFCHFLSKKFADGISLYNNDLCFFKPEKTFDLILWMWSGISDFSKAEHLSILSLLLSFLEKDGTLILDTFSATDIPSNATTSFNQYYIVQEKNTTAYGYIPSQQEIDTYAKALNISDVKQIKYETITGRKRILYLLHK